MTNLVYQTFLSASVTAALVITSNAAGANSSPQTGEILPNNSLISMQFALPGDAVPKTSVGGGVRGNVQFTLPSGATPRTSVKGGVRGNVQFTLPSGATPRTSVGAGVRGEEHPELTALVPPTKQGHTVSARPTIFVYLPPIGAEEAFLSLQDEEGNPFYKVTVKVPASGGTIAITLPAEAPELPIGKNYLCYFAPIEPGGMLRPDNYALVASTVNEQALASSPVELATAYAKAGI
jgi:hypothetical protein